MLLKTRKMLSMPGANAQVTIYDEDEFYTVTLSSYGTEVMVLDIWEDGAYMLGCTGIYGKSTARHINKFTYEWFGENLLPLCKAICGSECGKLKLVHQGGNPVVHANLLITLDNYLRG